MLISAARIPVGRTGYLEEVAEAVRWLAQPHQNFITGITLHLIVRRTQHSLLHWVDRGQH